MIEFEPSYSAVPFLGALFTGLLYLIRKVVFWLWRVAIGPILKPFISWLAKISLVTSPFITQIAVWLLSKQFYIFVFLFYAVLTLAITVGAALAVTALYAAVATTIPSEAASALGLIVPSNLPFLLTTIITAELGAFIYRVKHKYIWEFARVSYGNPGIPGSPKPGGGVV